MVSTAVTLAMPSVRSGWRNTPRSFNARARRRPASRALRPAAGGAAWRPTAQGGAPGGGRRGGHPAGGEGERGGLDLGAQLVVRDGRDLVEHRPQVTDVQNARLQRDE